MESKKGNFSGRLGFVLAAADSAVGLGNVWRFPYFVATYGGGNFLFVYLILAVTFGLIIMLTEIALGRKTGSAPVAAFKKLSPKLGVFGILAALVPAIIFPYYSVIGGWVARYAATFLTGGASAAAGDGYFQAFTGDTWSPIIWLGVFILITAILVVTGVDKGIEMASKFGMPIFLVMLVGLSIYGLTLPGAMEGLRYYLVPNFADVSMLTFIAAARQIFFSLSLSMGIMITYGAYLKKDTSIEHAVFQIVGIDTGVSFIAGLLVVPTVVAIFGAEGLGQGAGLMFITLPRVFAEMPAGGFVGATFFLMMCIAAVTSAVSLMEVVVATVIDWLSVGRKTAVVIVSIYSFLLALPTTLGFGIWSHIQIAGMNILGVMSFISDTVLIPVVALSTLLIAGWVMKPKFFIDEIKADGASFKLQALYAPMVKVVVPVIVAIILIAAILQLFGVISL